MIRLFQAAILIAGFIALSGNAHATDYSAVCNGCADWQMANKATQQTNDGIVWVWNYDNKKVKKYQVFTEVIDTNPYTVWTQALPITVNTSLKNAFSDFVSDYESFRLGGGTLVLPPEFPYDSVAGALTYPMNFETQLRGVLNSDAFVMSARLGSFLQEVFQNSAVGPVFGELIKYDTITIIFKDGTRIDVKLEIHDNNQDSEWVGKAESSSAEMQDGSTVPNDDPSTWDNFDVMGPGDTLAEWMAWADANGVSVTPWGSGGATPPSGSFTCTTSGSNIHCVVTGP